MSSYFNRTFSTPTNNKIYTFSAWVKRSLISSGNPNLLAAGTPRDCIRFEGSSDRIRFLFGEVSSGDLITTQVFRDVSAWYHLVFAIDTTQATASNRVKIYVNGSQITAFDTASYPSQNYSNIINSAVSHRIGSDTYGYGEDFYGLMTYIYFVDGQQLNASSFGETDSTTGIWKPKDYSGSYGNNGFFLKFENSGSLGTDSSGNGNNWTANNTPTQTLDTPSNVFATANNLDNYYFNGSYTNGNLTVTSDTTSYTWNTGTFGMSKGKWYWEIKVITETTGSQSILGISSTQSTGNTQELGDKANDYGYYAGNGNYRNNNTNTAYGNTYAVGDIISFALDLDNNKLYFGKNGTWQNSGVPTSGATGTGAISITASSSTPLGAYFPAWCFYDSSNYAVWNLNFGNGRFGTTAISSPYSDGAGLGKFQYQPPTGYYALCTKNINTYG